MMDVYLMGTSDWREWNQFRRAQSLMASQRRINRTQLRDDIKMQSLNKKANMKASKPWSCCDSILSYLTDTECFAFEDDEFLHFNELFKDTNQISFLSNPLQENIIPLTIPGRDLSKMFDQLVSAIDSRSLKLLQEVEPVEQKFTQYYRDLKKVDSPCAQGDSIHSPTTSVESKHNGSTSTTKDGVKKNYNLRSQAEEPQSKKRKTMDSDSDESSSSDEDEDTSFDPTSDSDVETVRITRSKSVSSKVTSSKSKSTKDSNEEKTKRKRKRTTYSKAHTDILKNFIIRNPDYPYPSEEQKQELLKEIEYSMTKEQLETWFVNHRKRYASRENLGKHKSQNHSGSHANNGFNSALEKKLKQEKKK